MKINNTTEFASYKTNFTTKEKTKIIKDWQALLKDLALDKNRWAQTKKVAAFHRIIGPLKIGVYIKFDTRITAKYEVSYSVYSLARKEEFQVANLYWDKISIDSIDHESKYRSSFEYLKQDVPIAIEGDISLKDIIHGFNQAEATDINSICIPVIVAAWAGDEKLAQKYLKLVREKLLINYSQDLAQKYISELEKLMLNSKNLKETTKEEIVKHKLTHAPYSEIKISY